MYIKRFEDITKEDVKTAGGKGANLGEMTRAGIQVPPGGVLTVPAYEQFMKQNQIAVTGEPAAIRRAILDGELPEDVKAEVTAFYRSMGGNVRIAVRSSATAEDLADASFAGQQETYLNIRGEERLLDSIKACYASLWGARAVSYRREKNYDRQHVALAVVLQRMVESETAGVLFTQDPMLINASYGLGESVVSGAVSPDELTCRRDGKIIRQVVGSKETMVVYGEKETVTVPVKPEDRSRLCITPGQAKELVKAGLAIEEHYGTPMDVEWAFVNGNLYILQARAITTKVSQEYADIPAPEVKTVSGRMKQSMLFMLEKEPVAYRPLDYDFSIILGKQKTIIFAEGGLLMENDCGMDENGFMTLPTGSFRLGRNIVHLPGLLSAMKDHRENIRKAKEALAQAKPEICRWAETDFGKLSLADCLYGLTELYDLITATAYVRFKYAVFPGFMMNRKLEKYLKKAGKDVTAYNLLAGLSYKTADMNYDLLALADRIMKNPAAKEAVLSGKAYQEITALVPETEEWFGEFLGKHGNKSDFNCYCFAAKTWIEDRERFLQVLRPLLTADRGKEMSRSEEEACYKALLGKMTAGMSEKQSGRLLQQVESYRFYHAYREETQSLWETAFYACRKALERTAELFGVAALDLQYLFWAELRTAMERGSLSAEELDKIAKRRNLRPAVEEYWKRQQWEALKGEGDTLKGVSGSAGEASGEVCVVTAPAEFGKLKKGDILVCRYTDPEWTPLFTLAAAVVSDTGGTLSHAAIVAREYNIPAVMAVGCATTTLKDGDRVFVNGTVGEVRCL